MNKVAFYGSLKRGFYNHGRCGEQHYIGDTTIKGKMTLVYDSYPQLFLTDEGNEHEVEVFNVDDLTFRQIDIMERGAGYEAVHINTPYGEATMWVFTDENKMYGRPIDAYTEDLLEMVKDY